MAARGFWAGYLPIPRGFRLDHRRAGGVRVFLLDLCFHRIRTRGAGRQPAGDCRGASDTIGNQIAAAGFNISAEDVKGFGSQILNSVGRVTAAVTSVVGTVTNMAMMLVLAIFIAAEPRMYERGVAWMLPLAEREHFYGTAEKIGRVLAPPDGGAIGRDGG